MSNPEARVEISSELKRKVGERLLAIHEQLLQLGVFVPETLSPEKTDEIAGTIDSLAIEAKSIGDSALAEVLSGLEVRFRSLHTVGVVDNLDKFQNQAGYAIDQLETVLLLTPSTSEATLTRIQEERARY